MVKGALWHKIVFVQMCQDKYQDYSILFEIYR